MSDSDSVSAPSAPDEHDSVSDETLPDTIGTVSSELGSSELEGEEHSNDEDSSEEGVASGVEPGPNPVAAEEVIDLVTTDEDQQAQPQQQQEEHLEAGGEQQQDNVDKEKTSSQARKRQRCAASSSPREPDGNECPICLEPCSSSGHHQLASLGCGHFFGHSCIQRWLSQRGVNQRLTKQWCPLCKTESRKADIRKHYATHRLEVVNTCELEALRDELHSTREETQRRVQRLERDNRELQFHNNMLAATLREMQHRIVPPSGAGQSSAHGSAGGGFPGSYGGGRGGLQVPPFMQASAGGNGGGRGIPAQPWSSARQPAMAVLPLPTASAQMQVLGLPTDVDGGAVEAAVAAAEAAIAAIAEAGGGVAARGGGGGGGAAGGGGGGAAHAAPAPQPSGMAGQFRPWNSLSNLQGARCFEVDGTAGRLYIPEKMPDGRCHLRKVSVMAIGSHQAAALPANSGIVRDIRLDESRRHALMAAMGKKLMVLEVNSNSLAACYTLPCPAWSCCWDATTPNTVYAGLANGHVLVLDLRNTAAPMTSLHLPITQPLHTLASLPLPRGGASMLGGCADGVYAWGNQQLQQQQQDAEVLSAPDYAPWQCWRVVSGPSPCVSFDYLPGSGSLVTSFRHAQDRPACHHLYHAPEAAAASDEAVAAAVAAATGLTVGATLRVAGGQWRSASTLLGGGSGAVMSRSSALEFQPPPRHHHLLPHQQRHLVGAAAGGAFGGIVGEAVGGAVGGATGSPASLSVVPPAGAVAAAPGMMMVASADEATRGVLVWDASLAAGLGGGGVGTGPLQRLPPHPSPVVAVRLVAGQDGRPAWLAALSSGGSSGSGGGGGGGRCGELRLDSWSPSEIV